MRYNKIYSVFNLGLLHFLIRAGFDCVKIMRARDDDKLVIFGFEETPELLAKVQEYKAEGYMTANSYQLFDKLRKMSDGQS